MVILGVLVVTLPCSEEFVIILQGNGPQLIFFELLVLLPITPLGLHTVLED